MIPLLILGEERAPPELHSTGRAPWKLPLVELRFPASTPMNLHTRTCPASSGR